MHIRVRVIAWAELRQDELPRELASRPRYPFGTQIPGNRRGFPELP
jgi:hypothetical protein